MKAPRWRWRSRPRSALPRRRRSGRGVRWRRAACTGWGAPSSHPPHCVPVLATSSTALCSGARHVINRIVWSGARLVINLIVCRCRCSPRQQPHCVPVLATSSTTLCAAGARHVINRIVFPGARHVILRAAQCGPPTKMFGCSVISQRAFELGRQRRAKAAAIEREQGASPPRGQVGDRRRRRAGGAHVGGRGLHPFPFQLNVSAFHGRGGARRGHSGAV